MDILLLLVICFVGQIWLIYAKAPRKPKKKREPLGAFLFGNRYYWYIVNRTTADRQ